MGMYTEISFSASLINDLPPEVINVINYLCNVMDNNDDNNKLISPLPEHDFFKAYRYKWLFHGSSYYFPQTIKPLFKNDQGYRLTFRSNIKNYGNEIEKFLNWIEPYIEFGIGTKNYYAVVCYQEQEEPTIYYKNK